jgi:Ca2+-binding EF-hand superfamily protein
MSKKSGEKKFSEKKQQQMLAEELVKKTHFNRFEIESLLTLFKQQTKTKLDRPKFRDVLHNQFDMTDDLIMDRVFKAFDKDSDSFVNMDEWVRGLSVFLRGTIDEHLKFCFEVYDFNGDGYISREEMFTCLKKSMVKQTTEEDPDEGIKDLVELALKKMDIDADHRVSFKDFQEAIKQESLLLQAFGQCLPDDKMKVNFEKRAFSGSCSTSPTVKG